MWVILLLVLAIVYFLVRTAKDRQSMKRIGILLLFILAVILMLGFLLASMG